MVHFQYLRKSRDRREREDPDVLRRHRAILEAVAVQEKVTIPRAHQFEELESGESVAKRPEFRRLLEKIRSYPDCARDHIQITLLCMDADRLSRGILTERGEIQELFIKKGVVIRTPAGITDLRDTDQRLLHNVKGALAEWELGKYKDRVAQTRAEQVRKGEIRTGSVPFGYLWDKNKKEPKPDPINFPVLQALCHEAFHTSIERLADKHGVPDHKVYRALRSPAICGWPAKTGTGKYLPRDQWVWPAEQGKYPVALEREDWERLQVVLDQRCRGYGGRSHKHEGWCKDVVQFVQCPGRARLGCYVYPKSQEAKNFDTYERSLVRRGKKLYVAREDVHAAVLPLIREVMTHPALYANLLAYSQHSQEAVPDEAALKHQAARLAKLLEGLEWDIHDPDTDPASIPGLMAARTRALAESKRLKAQQDQLRSHSPSLSRVELETLIAAAQMAREDFGKFWGEGGEDEKRFLVNAIVGVAEVTVTPAWPRHERTVSVRLVPWAVAVVAYKV